MRIFLILSFVLTFCAHSTICFAQELPIAITNVTVYAHPNAAPIKGATVFIKDGKFSSIEAGRRSSKIPGHREIDGSGKFVTAGFWNSHVHFIQECWSNAATQPADSLEHYLRSMLLSRGFVYAFDLAGFEFNNLNALRSRIASGQVKGPTVFAVGVPFTSKSPYYIKPLSLPELRTEQEVQAHVTTQLSERADGLKIWTASPTGGAIDYLSPGLIKKAAALAKSHGVPLFAHPSNLRGVQLAAENGVSVLAHVAADDRLIWDSMLVNTLVKRQVALIPTLQLHAWDLRTVGIHSDTSRLVETAVGQLQAFQKAGGMVIFGTDVGYMTAYDPAEEYELMQKAGMNFRQILASLTVNPARKFGRHKQTGEIKKGMAADLVLLDKDPAVDVRNFTAVNLVMHKGVIVYTK